MNTINRKRLRPPGKCIFCGGGNLSREHVWPQWAHTDLPTSTHTSNVRVSFVNKTELVGEPKVSRRQGGLASTTVRAVCATCNNGWMSRLEEAARPVLAPLIAGSPTSLTETSQQTLAEWITLKMMVAEHSPPPDPAIPEPDKRAFYTNRTIPRGLMINIFQCGAPQWRITYQRASATLSTREQPGYDTRPKNASSTVFALGDLFVHLIYFGDPGIQGFSLQDTGAGLTIWPRAAAEAPWPPSRRISSDEAQMVADAFQRLQNSPRVKVAP